MTRTCGTCTLCCKLFDINKPDEGIVKPGDTWCKWCSPGKGCGTYELRPKTCVDFQCAWLSLDFLPDELRPDKCKAIFQDTGHKIGITCTLDAMSAIHNEAVRQTLASIAVEQKFAVVIFKGDIVRVFCHHPDLGKNVANIPIAKYRHMKAAGQLRGLPNFVNAYAPLAEP